MYNKILKDETERIIFQYEEEFKRILTCENISIDEYLQDIDIEVEAHESYSYHSLVIDNHFKKAIVSESGENPNFEAFYEEYYNKVKECFLNELRKSYEEYMNELAENEEDMNYFINRDYLNEDYFNETEQVSEIERENIIRSYKKEIITLKHKIKTIKKAI